MANLATPVAAVYVTRVWSDFGEATVAGGAIVDRVIPLAFGVIFALTGSIGPIIGQNYGARLMPRVRRAISNSFLVAVGYALVAWAVLALASPLIAVLFEAQGASAQFVSLFCREGALAWVFVTCLFVANTAFNNLGFPVAVDGVQLGAGDAGDDSVRDGGRALGRRSGRHARLVAGSAIFGLGGVGVAYIVVGRLAKEMKTV